MPAFRESVSSQRRALALDALRGLSILMMVFANTMPNGLPSWMYHGQLPPPDRTFVPTLPGITWVDLVFPFFIFAMGAAIPLALSRRIESGRSHGEVVRSTLYRGFLLAGFAMFIQQTHPYVISDKPDWRIWMTGLLGFALLFPVLARLPESWTKKKKYIVRATGWAGAIILMAVVRFPDGSGFSVYRSDDIIMILANVAVFGGMIWLSTRDNWLFRISFMGILIAFRLSSRGPVWVPDFPPNSPLLVPVSFSGAPSEWIHSLWLVSPFPWLFQMRYLQYLFIIIPGTIVGDMILRWMKAPHADQRAEKPSWGAGKLASISLLMVLINIVVVIGLKAQWVFGTSIVAVVLCLIGWRLVAAPGNSNENLVSTLFNWGFYWLVLGLLFEPYEGGIKKDPATMSYYFVTTALAIFILIAFVIVIDILNHSKALRFLIDCGQNPMVAYAGADNLIPPILALTGLSYVLKILTPTPWLGVIGDAVITYLVALSTAMFTRKRVFLRT